MQAPRVAYFIDELRLGGATRQLVVLARALRPAVEPLVYCLSRRSEPLASELRDADIPVTAFERRLRWDPRFVSQLTRRLRDDGVDMVHGWLEASNAYAYLAARPPGLPVAFSLQSDHLKIGGIRGRAIDWMTRRALAVTVNSRAGYDFLVKRMGLPADRVTLVPNWLGVDIRPRDGAAPNPPVVAMLGRLVEMKRADLLIDALSLMRDRGSDARLEIVGDGPARPALEAQVAAAGLADRVTFAGMQMDVTSTLARARCVVIPSEFEGLPNTAVEALAAGLPIVARPVGDLPDLVREGETGRLVHEGSAPALAEALTGVLGDGALAEAARRAGPALVEERFSIAAAIDILVPLYEGLARTRQGTP